jgi:2-dehydro-3-deoxyphosphooctonate aldolase (KDO 8-P synthase)
LVTGPGCSAGGELARAAVAAGVERLFLEVHDDLANAKSDKANALDLKMLRPLLEKLLVIQLAAGNSPFYAGTLISGQ